MEKDKVASGTKGGRGEDWETSVELVTDKCLEFAKSKTKVDIWTQYICSVFK